MDGSDDWFSDLEIYSDDDLASIQARRPGEYCLRMRHNYQKTW